MLFKKKIINTNQYTNEFIRPFLDEIIDDCSAEILNTLKKEDITVSKNKKEIELEVAIWLYHIQGKLLSQVKIFENIFSPEVLGLNQEMLEHFYKRWGNGDNHEQFIVDIKKKYMEKVKAYETYEIPYSRGGILLEDFEAIIAVILLGVKYEELTRSFVTVVEELHKGSTALIHKFLKDFAKKFEIVNSKELNDEILSHLT